MQEAEVEPNDMKQRINQMIHLQHSREEVFRSKQLIQYRIKIIYDRRTKVVAFQIGYLVLKWDTKNKEKGKNGTSINLWKEPFNIVAFHGKNAYFLQYLSDEPIGARPVNGRLLKHFLV